MAGRIKKEKRDKGFDKMPGIKSKRASLARPLTVCAVICLIVYSIITVISQQVQISQIQKETDEISAKITEAKQQNDEYTRLLSTNDEAAYMERIAIERLGYAYPNERRFYIVDGN